MKATRTALMLGACLSAVGCDFNNAIDAIGDAVSGIGQQPAIAASGEAIANSGFYATADFPNRNRAYDGYLSPDAGAISDSQFSTLYNHVAFPQSRNALTSLLGHPRAYEGQYEFYFYNGSEVAIYYVGDSAVSFTVGY